MPLLLSSLVEIKLFANISILIITLILRPPNVVCHHSNSSYVNYYFASSSLTNAKDDALFNCFQCVLYFSIPQKNENFVTIISYGYDRNQLRAKTTVILMSYLEAISFNSLFFVIHLEFWWSLNQGQIGASKIVRSTEISYKYNMDVL